MDEIKPLVIGAIYDYEYSDIEPWLVSLKQSGYSGKVALIVYRGSKLLLDRLEEQNVYVFAFNKSDNGCECSLDLSRGIMSHRFFEMNRLLDYFLGDVTHIIATDVKDVVFQSNPIELLDDVIVVGREGFTYSMEPWSMNNMIKSFGTEVFNKLKNEQIICAGVIAGPRKMMLDLFKQIFLLTQESAFPDIVPGGGGPDQAALNITLASPQWKNRYKYTEKILHLGTSLVGISQGSGAISEYIYSSDNPQELFDRYQKSTCIESGPNLSGDKVIDVFGKIDYTIIHQYDRIPEWKNVIVNNYRE